MNLLKTLERSLDVDKEFRSYRDVGLSEQDNSEGTLITNLQFELIATLQILFAIYFIQQSPTKEECLIMVKYINSNTSRYNQSLLRRLGNQ